METNATARPPPPVVATRCVHTHPDAEFRMQDGAFSVRAKADMAAGTLVVVDHVFSGSNLLRGNGHRRPGLQVQPRVQARDCFFSLHMFIPDRSENAVDIDKDGQRF